MNESGIYQFSIEEQRRLMLMIFEYGDKIGVPAPAMIALLDQLVDKLKVEFKIKSIDVTEIEEANH